MKIDGKIICLSTEDVQNFGRSFFGSGFHSKNAIQIKEKEVQFSLYFEDEPPEEIMIEIFRNEVVCLTYRPKEVQDSEQEEAIHQNSEKGKENFKSSNFEQAKEAKENPETEKEVLEVQKFKQETATYQNIETGEGISESSSPEQAEEGVKNSETERKSKRKKVPTQEERAFLENVDVKGHLNLMPELGDVISGATSFKEEVALLAEWFEMGNRNELFQCIVYATKMFPQGNWQDLIAFLKSKDILWKGADRNFCAEIVTKKLKELNIHMTLLNFLKYIVQEERNTLDNQNVQEELKEQAKSEVNESSQNVTQEFNVKEKLKVIIQSLDKSQSIEKQIKFILNEMGLQKIPMEQQIVEMAKIAVSLKEKISLEAIQEKMPNNFLEVRMSFAEFLYEFFGERIKLINFLNSLKFIVS